MAKLLFYPGGPGLNANPERQLIGPLYLRNGFHVLFWDEPSSQRPADPYSKTARSFAGWLASAEGFFNQHAEADKVVLVAHSFGTHAVCALAEKYPERIEKIVILCSDLQLQKTDLNMFRIAMGDFESTNPELHQQLKGIISRYSGKFDENTAQGFICCSQDTVFFTHYWHKKELLPDFFGNLSGAYALDAEGFFQVRSTWAEVTMQKSAVPVLALFGKHDELISKESELEGLTQRFKNVEHETIDNTGHYPHLEEPEQVLARIKAFLAR